LLFDARPGVRDIVPVAQSLTQKPITALPSRMHYDPTGNLHRFDHIAVADLTILGACETDGMLQSSDDLYFCHYEDVT
jgi:hypothetical protein